MGLFVTKCDVRGYDILSSSSSVVTVPETVTDVRPLGRSVTVRRSWVIDQLPQRKLSMSFQTLSNNEAFALLYRRLLKS